MIIVINEEERNLCQNVFHIIVEEFCEKEKIISIILLIIAKNSKVLFQYLIDMFHLFI